MIVIEGTVDLNKEDGGAALISYPISADENKDSGLYVRICSWDEDFWNGDTKEPNHPDVEALRGKKVRITIEEIS